METERLSPQAYADKMGRSRQGVNQAINTGALHRLKGVSKVESMTCGNGRQIHVLHYNPDYK